MATSTLDTESVTGNPLLDECRRIGGGIAQVQDNLAQLRQLQQRTLHDADSSSNSAANCQLNALSDATLALCRDLTNDSRTLKSNPEAKTSKNKTQVDHVDRCLKTAIQDFQKFQLVFRQSTKGQFARQYRIVCPGASNEEVQAAFEDPDAKPVFNQALMKSSRQGRAMTALSAVQERKEALADIERQMVELAQLFRHLDTLVVQQEVTVTQIEQEGEEVVEDLDKGNEEMGVAVQTARKTRRKKWICLGISVAIVVVIIIAVLIYVFINRSANNK